MSKPRTRWCLENTDCMYGERCSSHKCMGCSADVDCDHNTVCSNGVCKPSVWHPAKVWPPAGGNGGYSRGPFICPVNQHMVGIVLDTSSPTRQIAAMCSGEQDLLQAIGGSRHDLAP